MRRRTTIAALTLASVVAFVIGAATSFLFLAARFATQVDNISDGLLVDRTMLLQHLRDGNSQFVEQYVEALAWNQVISVGRRQEQGETPSPRIREAIQYNCRRFAQQKAALDPKLVEQREYWCSQFPK